MISDLKYILSVLSVALAFTVAAQHTAMITTKPTSDPPTRQNQHLMHAVIIEGDTVPMVYLRQVRVVDQRKFKNKREQNKYWRLRRNVKKVYPYAKLAGAKLNEYGAQMTEMTTEREKKKFLKMVERDLKAEYEGELRKLTVTQGRILIKLIDRETGDTSYELVKELRGTFSAFFWQSLARIFGHNLKSHYDPEGEDRLIEEIVAQIEAGII